MEKSRRSKEDYLKAILVLSRQPGEVRSVDVAEYMGYSKASVSRAVGQLVREGLAVMEPQKYIRLTARGRRAAQKVYEKHCFFRDMFVSAGLTEPSVTEEAHRMEHAISDRAFQAIKRAFAERGGKG